MASEKQLAANRANAKLSKGPKSKRGKIRSSMNSCKHGLSAEAITIDGEDPAEFDELLRSLIEEFNPRPGAEDQLVFRLASLFWRARRIPVFEATFLRTRQPESAYRDPRVDRLIEDEILRREKMTEIAKRYRADKAPTKDDHEEKDNHAEKVRASFEELLASQPNQPVTSESENQEMLAKISRYETALMNSIIRTLNMLIGLQNMRGVRAEGRAHRLP